MLWHGSLIRAQDFKRQYVVVLLPFESRVLTTGDFDTGMKSVPFGRRVVFYPEFLDIVRFPDLKREESVTHYLRSKYATQKVDVVVAAGFAGLSFAMKRGAEIFGDAPVVFVGVEQSRFERLHIPRAFTGVTHFDDVRGTVEVALKL